MYVILLFLGLIVGGVFITILLINDRREDRRKKLQDDIAAANQAQPGTWPPPPTERVPMASTEPVTSTKAYVNYYKIGRRWVNIVSCFVLGVGISALAIRQAFPNADDLLVILISSGISVVGMVVWSTLAGRKRLLP